MSEPRDPALPPSALPAPFAPARPVVIGLAGGVASGKSTVAAAFAAHGLVHIDADACARALSNDADVLAQVRAQLGEAFVSDGQLDRAALADRVFSDPTAKAALEAILHPRVRARILADMEQARDAGRSSLLDVPLLFEAGLWELCDRVVFVEASGAARRERARARGWADDELDRREQSQLPLHEKRERSDHIVCNDGSLEETRRAVGALLRQLEATS